MALVVRGVLQRRGHDARRQAERRVVGGGQRLVIVFHADHGSDRAEDLFAVDTHRVVRVGEQRRRQVVARRVALHAVAAGGQGGAFAAADVQVLQVLRKLALVDDRADVGAGLARIVDLQRLHTLDHRGDEAVMDACGDDDA